MSAAATWGLFAAIGLGTFFLRLSFIYLFGKMEMPDWLRRALRFVPAAVLAALVFPALTHTDGVLNLSPLNFRLIAGLVGALVAWKTKNVLLTIASGMLVLWILQFIWG